LSRNLRKSHAARYGFFCSNGVVLARRAGSASRGVLSPFFVGKMPALRTGKFFKHGDPGLPGWLQIRGGSLVNVCSHLLKDLRFFMGFQHLHFYRILKFVSFAVVCVFGLALPVAAQDSVPGLPAGVPESADGAPLDPIPLVQDPLQPTSGNRTGPSDPPAPVIAPPPLETVDLKSVFKSVSGTEGAGLRLTARDMVMMALSNNADIKVQRLQPELGDTEVRRALGLFDPRFNFQSTYSQSDTPQNAQEFIATGGETTQSQLALIDQLVSLQSSLDSLLAEIQGTAPPPARSADGIDTFTDPRIFSSRQFSMLWQVGGLTPLGTQYGISLSQAQDWNDLNEQIPPSLFYPETTSIMALTVTQPLLKNFGPAANMAAVRISRLQRRIGWYEWKQQLIRSLNQGLNLYFDLLFAHENLRVREQAVDAAQQLEMRNIRRVQQGKMRPADVWQAQTSLSFNVDLALRAINAYVEAQNNLKQIIFTEQMALAAPPQRLVPVDSLDMPKIEIDRSKFLGEAFAKRPEYLQIVSRAEQDGIRVRFARNQAYPQVDLQASYGLTGLEGEYGSSLDNAFSGQGTAFSAGVVVSIPLGNIEGRATLDAAKYRQQQSALILQKAGTEVSIEIDTAISLLETSRQQVIAAKNTAMAARNTADAENKLLAEGRTTTFDVVRLQNDAADAESRELAAIAAYRKNVVRLAVARGILLDELGINMQEEAQATRPKGNRRKLDVPDSQP